MSEDHVLSRIRAAADSGTLGHAFIISGRGDREAAARFIAAAMECTAHSGRPCGKCAACGKVERNTHPDVITAEDPDHKMLPVDYIRALRSDAYILPNEGERKVYIFPDCLRLDPKAQDVMLKTVEEGPSRAAFIFCAENSSTLLQTIRSRCIELRLEDTVATEIPDAAFELCDCLCQKKEGVLISFLSRLENSKIQRDRLLPLFSGAREICAAALLSLYGQKIDGETAEYAQRLAKSLTKVQLAGIIDMLEIYADDSRFNVGVGHTLGGFGADVIPILKKQNPEG